MNRAATAVAARRYIDAILAHDINGAIDCFAEVGVHAMGTLAPTGREALAEFFEQSFAMAFQVECDDEVLIAPNQFSARFTITVATTGAEMVVLRVANMARLDDAGKITYLWALDEVVAR